MRKRFAYALIGTTVAAVVAVGTLTANAEWVISAKAAVKIRTAKVPAGKKPSVAKQSKAAVVSWSALEIAPGVRMNRYTVTAHSQDLPAKPKIVREIAASGGGSESVTFADAEVAGGKWRWTVIPRFAKWTGAESGLSEALNFPAAPAGALAAEPPEAKKPAPITSDPPPAPTAESTSKPAAEPPPTPPAAPPKDDTEPPPASSPAEAEPPVREKEPAPSASGPAAEDIPE
ncbi:hypothetical protein [Actinoplanes solisilvae]|uniref:hypothetical protein n=1 Tax=Actinoplanes solisilvae TaxID=2486853 RepID=UPI000FD704AE|nr:hypothetical protein [Actinoplanes solisilvae]